MLETITAHIRAALKTKKTRKPASPYTTRAAVLTGLAGTFAVEALIAGSIMNTNHEVLSAYGMHLPLAWVEASLSVTMGLLSTFAAAAAQRAASDMREKERSRATGLRLLSWACLIGPVIMLGAAYTYPKKVADHNVYVETGLRDSDAATVALAKSGQWVEPQMLADARYNLETKGTPPKTAALDLEKHPDAFLWALLVYVIVTQVPGALWQPPAETPREARQREAAATAKYLADKKAETALKALKTRRANKAKNARKNAARPPLGNVFSFAK